MYNFLNLIFGIMISLSILVTMVGSCLISIVDTNNKIIRCAHLYSKKILFYCLFIGGCIHVIF